MSDFYPIKRALISVSDKTDITKLAKALFQAFASLVMSVLSDTEINARLIG